MKREARKAARTILIVATMSGLFAVAGEAQTVAHSAALPQPQLAITIDDLPVHGGMGPGETRIDIARRTIAALKAENVPAIGFINGERSVSEPNSAPVLDIWARSGLSLGNHTWSHPNLDALELGQYRDEIAKNEPLLSRLQPKGDWHWFRYPFLSEGSDPAKRSAIRTYLADKGYRIAAVSMSFDDWAMNDPYSRCATKGDTRAVARLEQEYLDAARAEAIRARAVARVLYGRDVPYVLLLHLGALDARMMPRLLALYRELGFRFVSIEDAQKDPAYAADVDPRLEPAPTVQARLQDKGATLPPRRAAAVDFSTICS